jgi:prephenate dehydrogenase
MLEPSDPDFLRHTRLAIVGLGLMGGSLALALRGHCGVLLGIDPDPAVLEQARRTHLVDAVAADPADLLPMADAIVLAAPVSAILGILEALPALHPGPALVLDLGSTKTAIVEAMARLPERFDPIGGHPMCGKERGGLAQADAALFRGAPFAFVPVETHHHASPHNGVETHPEQNIEAGHHTGSRAGRFAAALAEAVGARPLWFDAATHDCWVAATSHLPYLIANALAGCTPPEAAPLVGSGFRSTTRLAPTPPGMMMDVLMTNSQNILAAARRFGEAMQQMETLLAAGDTAALQKLLEGGGIAQARLLEANERGNPL